MINKTDALVHRLLTDAIKDKVILITSKPVVNGFYQKILRENVIILDKNIKHYFEGPQRT